MSRSRLAAAAAIVAVGTMTIAASGQTSPSISWLDPYREAAARLTGDALGDHFAWRRLAELTDTFGNRLSGSSNLERAIQWAAAEMKKDGLENVRTEKVMVPHWVRGDERLEIVQPPHHALPMLGLGGSVGTAGLEAEPFVVRSFDELEQNAARAKGRIVVFNVPYTTYGETVVYRASGASRAARHGAVAMLVRAVGPPGLRTPHTGALRYDDTLPKIPAASISSEDADRLQRMQERGTRVRLRLTMGARLLPDAESANVVGELRGRERPDEVVVIGGHLDSWDVGTGASDDGGGCIVTWEALRLMKKLNLRPRRTVRVVLFTNEENGGRGGHAYLDRYRADLKNHVMMMESDSGVFRPVGFGFSGSDAARRVVTDIATLLRDIGADRVFIGGGGADIGPSVREGHIPALSLNVDGNYFLIHHTQADTVDKIDPADIARSAAAVAVMTYVIAEMPQRLSETKN